MLYCLYRILIAFVIEFFGKESAMKSTPKKHFKDILLTALLLLVTFGISILLQDVFNIWEHITTLFVFAVFLISLLTDGYLYGIASAVIAVLAINIAFTDP